MSGNPRGGQLILTVLHQALKEFGKITPQNQAEVAVWVQRRVQRLTGDQRYAVADLPFDPKMAAAGERDE